MRKLSQVFCLLSIISFSSCIKEDVVTVEGETTIEASKNALLIGDTASVTAYYTERGIVAQGVDFEWILSNNDVITLNENGIVEAIDTGSVMITASAFGNESNNVMINVILDSNEISEIVITPERLNLEVGQSSTISYKTINLLKEEITPENVVIELLTPSVGTMQNDSVFVSSAEGEVQIQITADGISQVVDLQVFNSLTRSGDYETIDYTTSGGCNIELTGDNKLFIHFEDDFLSPQAVSLPGSVAYLANSNSASVAKASGRRGGAVTQSSGAFSIEVPTSTPMEDFQNFDRVLMICEPFTVPIAVCVFDN